MEARDLAVTHINTLKVVLYKNSSGASCKVKSHVITLSDLEHCPRLFRYRLCKYSTFVYRLSHPLREIAIWPYGLCQSEPKLPGLYKKHTAAQQDEAQNSEHILDRQTP